MAWDDAPPTKEELSANPARPGWDSAPPSPEELAQVAPGPETSPVTAAASSLINGATANWAPALGAAGKTAMDAITGLNGPLGGGSLDDLVDEYKTHRDELRSKFAKAAAAHPHIALAGNLAGGATTLGAIGPAAASAKGLAAQGAAAGLGATDINKPADLGTAAANTAGGAATSLLAGKAIEAAAPVVGKALAPVGRAISSGFQGAADALGGTAEGLAEKATGATAAQAEKFSEGTGRELLDRGIVKFGSSPGDVAANANAAMDAAEASKQAVLKDSGATVDRNTVYNYIRQKIQELSGDESKVDVVKKLEGKLEDITGVANQTGEEVPLAQSEQIRRGFDSAAKWNSASDAPTLEANKITANAYREAGEGAANAADPELGAQFKAAKTTQRTLIPVAEAAERRALQLQQSPHGGLLDAAHAGVGATVGAAIGGPVGAVVGAGVGLGAKALRPRVASIGAVSADNLSKVVAATPHLFGKFAGALQSAAARGAVSLGATDYILQQTNPEYREQRKSAFPGNEEEIPSRTISSDTEGP